jgi:hypothetical protein
MNNQKTPIIGTEGKAKTNASSDPYEVAHKHADNATIENPFPTKTKNGYKYKRDYPACWRCVAFRSAAIWRLQQFFCA